MENILENNRAQPRPSKQTVTQILRFIRDVTGKSNHKTAVKQKKAQLSCSSHGTAHEFSQRYPAAPASHHAVLAETRVHPAPTLHLRNSRTTPHGCSTPRPLTAPQAHSSAPRIEHPRRACFASRRFRRNAGASSCIPAIPAQRCTSVSRAAASRLRKRARLCRGLSISPARVFSLPACRRCPHGVRGCRPSAHLRGKNPIARPCRNPYAPSALLRGKNSPTLRYWKISGSLRMSSCSAFVTAGRLRLQSSASCSCVSCGIPSSWQRLTT